MVLIMIIGLALLIYALADRQLGLELEKINEKIPDQKGKPTSTPTIRCVFQIFEEKISCLSGSMDRKWAARFSICVLFMRKLSDYLVPGFVIAIFSLLDVRNVGILPS